ncbi:MAG: hypothetical protein ACRCV5_05715, partial [Afipia sp.]
AAFLLFNFDRCVQTILQYRNSYFLNPIKLTFKPPLNDLAPEIAGSSMRAWPSAALVMVRDLSRKNE